MESEMIQTIKEWQTLIASSIAIIAACIAWHNTTRTLRAAAVLETKRRNQKHAALRAVLPLSLSEISSYCVLTTRSLQNLWDECVDNALPNNGEIECNFPVMPNDTVEAFAEFIEYADNLDVSLFKKMLARLQIIRARTGDIARTIEVADQETIILSLNLEEYILDAAAIYASAAAAFDYGRHTSDALFHTSSDTFPISLASFLSRKAARLFRKSLGKRLAWIHLQSPVRSSGR